MKTSESRQGKLRADAEKRLAKQTGTASVSSLSNGTLHELQVHQIELEMQNEQLRDTQSALQESRDRYRDLFDFAPVGYFTLGETGQITEVNAAGVEMLGTNMSDLDNRPFADIVAPKDKDRWLRDFSHAMRHKARHASMMELTGLHGKRITAHLEFERITPIHAARALGISMTDVSQTQSLIEDLQMREDRLKLAKNAGGLGIFDHDLISGAHYFDERLRKFWGFDQNLETPVTRDQVIAAIHPDDRTDVQALLERALDPRGNGNYRAEYRVVSQSDGRVRHVIVNGQVFFKDGQATRFVGIVKDISSQKRLKEELQARRIEMEQLVNRQVAAQTAAAIAHELNQPLVAISAYSEAALRMLESGVKDTDKLKRALQGAMEQSQRAGRSLHQLLELLHEGETVLESVDLNQAIIEAVSMAKSDWIGGLQLILKLEEHLPPVLAHPLIIKKVLINLLHNGMEAMRSEGIADQAMHIDVCTHRDTNMARVSVRDYGPGIKPEIVDSLFKPLYTTKPKGMGFGLPISKRLVESCGGKIWLDTEASSGATFHFTLPFIS